MGAWAQSALAVSPKRVILGARNNISQVKRLPETRSESPAHRAIQRRISARSAIIIDGASNRVLFAKNPDTPRQPASTIKVLTGAIALKALTGTEPVPVSRKAASRPSSKMYLDPRRTYPARELINGLLLASANDASVALAELLAGDENAFARVMTRQAQLWGATRTVCKTASGLTARGQASTAHDLAVIFKHAMRDPEFAEIMKRRVMQTPDGHTFYNHNKALWRISGAEAGKTGYTLAARQTYVGQFKRGKAEIVVAIMGSESMWHDLKYLVRYGFKEYEYLPPPEQDDSETAAGLVATSPSTSAAAKSDNS